jgi:predicted AAA+ superfamily ATPase
MYRRQLDLGSLLSKANFFLFGPRATGKSSLIQEQLSDALIIDLLDDDVYATLLRRPSALSEKMERPDQIIVIDEVQKLPKILDEVHRLIQKKKVRFLLTGSSARKLKREGANMLAGRAREVLMFPLSYSEITNFDLIRYLNFGGLPIVYQSSEPTQDLKAYVKTYLTEEIKIEAAVRNYERFVRFLETMAISNGTELNYANISRDCGVPVRTLEGYVEVLKDTLIAWELMPFTKTKKRKAVTRSKIYFFDTGVANFLAERLPLNENHSDIGTCFEQFLIQEVRAYLSYQQMTENLTYWRSKDLEVDLVVGRKLAVEFKMSKSLKSEFFKGLHALKSEGLIKSFILVGRFSGEGETEDGIKYMNYQIFLERLWNQTLLPP